MPTSKPSSSNSRRSSSLTAYFRDEVPGRAKAGFPLEMSQQMEYMAERPQEGAGKAVEALQSLSGHLGPPMRLRVS